jgi:tRNA(Ile)-lysidine synthase
VIPLLEKAIPGLKPNVLSNINRFREVEILYREAIDQYKKKLLEFKGREIHIPVLKLKKVEPLHSVLYEIVKEYDFTAHQATEIVSLLDAGSGKYLRSPTHRVIRNRQWLIIAPDDPSETGLVIIDGPGDWEFAGGRLLVEMMQVEEGQPGTETNVAFLDAKEIAFPLLLRKWKQGDYFYPLGMAKKKKLSRFFIDKKLSKTEKENTWVVETGKKIAWVVGHRIDDRFKITDKTKNVLKIRSSL